MSGRPTTSDDVTFRKILKMDFCFENHALIIKVAARIRSFAESAGIPHLFETIADEECGVRPARRPPAQTELEVERWHSLSAIEDRRAGRGTAARSARRSLLDEILGDSADADPAVHIRNEE